MKSKVFRLQVLLDFAFIVRISLVFLRFAKQILQSALQFPLCMKSMRNTHCDRIVANFKHEPMHSDFKCELRAKLRNLHRIWSKEKKRRKADEGKAMAASAARESEKFPLFSDDQQFNLAAVDRQVEEEAAEQGAGGEGEKN